MGLPAEVALSLSNLTWASSSAMRRLASANSWASAPQFGQHVVGFVCSRGRVTAGDICGSLYYSGFLDTIRGKREREREKERLYIQVEGGMYLVSIRGGGVDRLEVCR